MSKRVLVSTSAAARLREASAWLLGELDEGDEILLLAPTRGAGDDLLRRATAERAGLFGVHRATLLQLACDLATRPMAERRLAPVSALGVEALAARSIARCHEAGELAYFGPVAETPGLARALASTLRELRTYHIERRELAATGPSGADLARLLEAYEEELARWSLADDTLIFQLAAEECEAATHYLLDLPLLALDVSPGTAAERDLMAALVSRAPRALATVPEGDAEGREALEAVFAAAAESLPAARTTTLLERLRQRVFELDLAEEPPAEDDGSLVFVTAAGEGRECVEIARRIRDLALEGVTFDSIAILLRDPQSYLPLIEEALRRARIPAYFTGARFGRIRRVGPSWRYWLAQPRPTRPRASPSTCRWARCPSSRKGRRPKWRKCLGSSPKATSSSSRASCP